MHTPVLTRESNVPSNGRQLARKLIHSSTTSNSQPVSTITKQHPLECIIYTLVTRVSVSISVSSSEESCTQKPFCLPRGAKLTSWMPGEVEWHFRSSSSVTFSRDTLLIFSHFMTFCTSFHLRTVSQTLLLSSLI